MITYEQDKFGLKLLVMWRGSVFPGAAKFAIVPALVACGINILCQELEIEYDLSKLREGYGSFIFVLGFALVFRSSQGYSRYWDGANLLRQMRTEWHDAAAQICCFCMTSGKTDDEKDAYKSCVVRLFSLLHCLALQQIADMEDESFEVIDLASLDPNLLQGLKTFHEPLEKAEIVCQWIQRVILEGVKESFLPTPPPIVSRAFQEMNAGMVCCSKLQAITDNPFPFPYAQMIALFLGTHWLLTPILIGMLPAHWAFCAVFSFISVFSLCALNLIAQEIENPFGDDANDLRCDEAQCNMNDALLTLLSAPASMLPNYRTVKKLDSDQSRQAKRRQTHRLSYFLPIHGDEEEEDEGSDSENEFTTKESVASDAGKKRSSFSKETSVASEAGTKRSSFVQERKRESLILHQTGEKAPALKKPDRKQGSRVGFADVVEEKEDESDKKEPAKGPPPVVNAQPDKTQASPPPALKTSLKTSDPVLQLSPIPPKTDQAAAPPAPSKPNDLLLQPSPSPVTSPQTPDPVAQRNEIATPLDFWIHLEESSKRVEILHKQSVSELKDMHSILGQMAQMVAQHVNNKPVDGSPDVRKSPTKNQSEGSCRLFPVSCHNQQQPFTQITVNESHQS